MSMQQSSSRAVEPAPDAGEITLTSWLAEGRRVDTRAALDLIRRIASALRDAHLRGVRHGALSAADVVLPECSDASFGTPRLRGFAPSSRSWPRREDVATDVAGLAGIAQALLLPARAPARGRRTPAPPPARLRATAAVIGAGTDRREGVFVFESPMDFVAALEAAVAADAGAPPSPDPALLAMRLRRRRRRVLKVVTGTAVACLALLVVSNPTATHRSPDAAVARVLRR
jgi:hypothetical protein